MNYEVEFHPDFFDDIKKLNQTEKEAITKQILKIERNPERYLHLSGEVNCYRIRIGSLRLIYYLYKSTVYILMVYKRGKVYSEYQKRLYNIKQKLDLI